MALLTEKPSGSWTVDAETGVWTPADAETIAHFGAESTYEEEEE